MGVAAEVLRAAVNLTLIIIKTTAYTACVVSFYDSKSPPRHLATFSTGNIITMSSFLWPFPASEGSLPYTAGGLAALFREAIGWVVPCECCRGVTVGCFCRATMVFFGLAVARERFAVAVARCGVAERGEDDVVFEFLAALEMLIDAEEDFDWWWDENAEARHFLDALSPSERGMAWRWRLQRAVLLSMLSDERRFEQREMDGAVVEDDA